MHILNQIYYLENKNIQFQTKTNELHEKKVILIQLKADEFICRMEHCRSIDVVLSLTSQFLPHTVRNLNNNFFSTIRHFHLLEIYDGWKSLRNIGVAMCCSVCVEAEQ